MPNCKYKVGDLVVYKSIIGEVVSVSHNSLYKDHFYQLSLVSIEDEDMTCTATESECEQYIPSNFDEEAASKAMNDAKFNSAMVLKQVDSISDKYIGDE